MLYCSIRLRGRGLIISSSWNAHKVTALYDLGLGSCFCSLLLWLLQTKWPHDAFTHVCSAFSVKDWGWLRCTTVDINVHNILLLNQTTPLMSFFFSSGHSKKKNDYPQSAWWQHLKLKMRYNFNDIQKVLPLSLHAVVYKLKNAEVFVLWGSKLRHSTEEFSLFKRIWKKTTIDKSGSVAGLTLMFTPPFACSYDFWVLCISAWMWKQTNKLKKHLDNLFCTNSTFYLIMTEEKPNPSL